METESTDRPGGEVDHFTQYKVLAAIQFNEDGFHELESDWIDDRNRAVETAKAIGDDHLVEIHTRTIGATAKPEEVPL